MKMHLSGPVAGILALYLSIWKISVCGCLLSALAVCACFYADSIVYLMVCLGVVQGTRSSFCPLQHVQMAFRDWFETSFSIVCFSLEVLVLGS